MKPRATVALLPGFNGRADQPILVKLEARLAAKGFACVRLAPPRLALTPGLDAHVDWLDAAMAKLEGRLVVVGRSFGGRLAVRLAARRELAAVLLLGFPVRPPKKRRPLDEAALAALRCPAWIAQGTKDALGPLRVLKQFAGRAEVYAVAGAGHSFAAKQEAQALDAAAAWLDRAVP